MGPKDRRYDNEHEGAVPDEVIHDLVTPLTVVLGHVQLARRRFRQGEVLDHDAFLHTLWHIEHAARMMDTRLRELREVPSHPTSDRASDPYDGPSHEGL